MVEVIVLAAVLAGIVGAFVAAGIVVYYMFFFQTGLVPESDRVQAEIFGGAPPSEEAPDGWIDVSEYNGMSAADVTARPASVASSRSRGRPQSRAAPSVPTASVVSSSSSSMPAPAAAAAVSAGTGRPQSRANRPQSRASPSRPQSRASRPAEAVVLPTDMRMDNDAFLEVLKAYYKKFAPSFGDEELDLAMEAYGKEGAGRAELDRNLGDEYGQGLDEYYVAAKNGTDSVAPRRAASIPSIRIVGNNVNVDVNDSDQLRRTLESRGLGAEYVETLQRNGINTLDEMRAMNESVIAFVFPNPDERERLTELIHATRLLGVGTSSPDM